MSLKPTPIQPVPEGTARVARAAFRRGNPLLKLRDELGSIFQDEDFADLFPKLGQPGLPPWRLALVTLLQFREDLSDRRAAEAVRARIDWKYLLGLELDDPGFDASVLCEFRARLLEGAAEERLLGKLLAAELRERRRRPALGLDPRVPALDQPDQAGDVLGEELLRRRGVLRHARLVRGPSAHVVVPSWGRSEHGLGVPDGSCSRHDHQEWPRALS
jgi:transposase